MSEVSEKAPEPAEAPGEGGIKRARDDEDEEKGKVEEGRPAKAQKTAPGGIAFEPLSEELVEKLEEVPPMSEPKEPGDEHEEVKTLERGHIFFFYRPKVDQEHAEDFKDVQRSYMLLYPDGEEAMARLLIVPKKKLPDIHKKSDRVWSFVDVAGSIDACVSALKESTYNTAKGKRRQGGARLLARGVYTLANHKEPKTERTFSNHVHLAYVMTHPEVPHALQRAFHVYDEGDFVIQVKNPAHKREHAKEVEAPPEEIQKLFAGHNFVPLNPPELINHKGAEVILIAAHHYPTELEEVGEKLEAAAEREKHRVTLKKIKTELHVSKSDPNMSLDPLQGKWD